MEVTDDSSLSQLLIIDSLMLSGIEENVDVAEILQNKLYYEGETLGMILNIMSRYTKQSLSFVAALLLLTGTDFASADISIQSSISPTRC